MPEGVLYNLLHFSTPSDSYREKEAQRLHRENTDLVNSLEYWRPATPLIWRPNKNYTKTELITQSLEVQG